MLKLLWSAASDRTDHDCKSKCIAKREIKQMAWQQETETDQWGGSCWPHEEEEALSLVETLIKLSIKKYSSKDKQMKQKGA